MKGCSNICACLFGRLKLIIFLMMIILCTVKASSSSSSFYLLNRSSFPHGFIFGSSSSAYQYEGAAGEDGRGPSIWDTFSHNYPGKIKDYSNGDVAVDSYHRYKEDVKIIKDMGLDAYRFSISWSRVLPKGKLSGGINWDGIRYYNHLIDGLLLHGIKPFVTLLHSDLPQALEDDYGGFLSRQVVDDFRDYAEVCYREFGDRVKHWMTLNEPLYYSLTGYAFGNGPPGRCSKWLQLNCTAGDSGTEPYIVAHNQILAHATAVTLYKHKYQFGSGTVVVPGLEELVSGFHKILSGFMQASQKGHIGIVLATIWFVPLSKSVQDYNAAQRSMDFTLGWFMEPLMRGKYPQTMSKTVKDRLPKFTKEESKLVKGSFDFIGLNYYSATYAANSPPSSGPRFSYTTDWHVNLTSERKGIPIGPKVRFKTHPIENDTPGLGLNVYPRGIRELLHYTKKKYKTTQPIYITENGICESNNASLSLIEALDDRWRIDFHYQHLSFLREAIQGGVDVRGYFIWSLLDDFEWGLGYTVRYGFNFVDYNDGLKRYPKSSVFWFKSFLQK